MGVWVETWKSVRDFPVIWMKDNWYSTTEGESHLKYFLLNEEFCSIFQVSLAKRLSKKILQLWFSEQGKLEI